MHNPIIGLRKLANTSPADGPDEGLRRIGGGFTAASPDPLGSVTPIWLSQSNWPPGSECWAITRNVNDFSLPNAEFILGDNMDILRMELNARYPSPITELSRITTTSNINHLAVLPYPYVEPYLEAQGGNDAETLQTLIAWVASHGPVIGTYRLENLTRYRRQAWHSSDCVMEAIRTEAHHVYYVLKVDPKRAKARRARSKATAARAVKLQSIRSDISTIAYKRRLVCATLRKQMPKAWQHVVARMDYDSTFGALRACCTVYDAAEGRLAHRRVDEFQDWLGYVREARSRHNDEQLKMTFDAASKDTEAWFLAELAAKPPRKKVATKAPEPATEPATAPQPETAEMTGFASVAS